MSNWITDRRPTEKDADYGFVWITTAHGQVLREFWKTVRNNPWMPITPPEPYVKPKRFVVFEHGGVYGVMDSHDCKIASKCIPTREAAERIAAIYEEVMP